MSNSAMIRKKKFRREVWKRSDKKCFYCKVDLVFKGNNDADNKFTIDHLQAQVYGGKWSLKNCVASCLKCNKDKGHKNLFEYVVEKDKQRKG